MESNVDRMSLSMSGFLSQKIFPLGADLGFGMTKLISTAIGPSKSSPEAMFAASRATSARHEDNF
jgi:hypothetical protein